jgi:hypothetical protein
LAGAAAAPFVKHRSADAERRLQLRWFAYVCTAIAAAGVLSALAAAVSDTAASILFGVATFGIAAQISLAG